MDELVKLLQEYTMSSILILFVTFILIMIGIYEVYVKIKGFFSSYYSNRSAEEKKESDLNERITKLEEQDKESNKELSELKTDIDEIKELIARLQANQNKSNRATCRSAMYRLSSELISKGWMTQTEYDTLSELVDVYLMSGSGNENYVRPAAIQRALSLPVLTDDEIKNKKIEESKPKRGRKPKNTAED